MEAHPAALPRSAARGSIVRLARSSDERLAGLIADGADAAFAALYERYHQTIYRYCRSLVGSEVDGQDALQATFTQALIALRAGRRDAPMRPWLFRIAHNESISLLRRRRPVLELAEDGGPPERGADEVAETRERLASLVSDLLELPARQRGALVMRELNGLSHEEVSHALGISVGATKQTVLEARRSLHEFAEGRAMPCEQIERTISEGDRRALRGRRIRAHLRACPSCTAFAAAIPARRAELLALAPPLPAAAAAGLLAQIVGGGAPHAAGGIALGATGSAHAGGAAATGAVGKGLGAALTAKGLAAGAAIVAATAAVGAGVVALHPFSPATRPARSGAAGAGVKRAGAVTHRGRSGATASGRHSPAAGGLATGPRSPAQSGSHQHAAGATAPTGSSRTAAGAAAGTGANAVAPTHGQGATKTPPATAHHANTSHVTKGHARTRSKTNHSKRTTHVHRSGTTAGHPNRSGTTPQRTGQTGTTTTRGRTATPTTSTATTTTTSTAGTTTTAETLTPAATPK